LRNEAEKVRTLLIYLKCYTQGLFLSPDCVKYSVIYFLFPLCSEKHTVIINLHTTDRRDPFAASPGRGNFILVDLFIVNLLTFLSARSRKHAALRVRGEQRSAACARSRPAPLFTSFWGAFGNLLQQGRADVNARSYNTIEIDTHLVADAKC
jgi:hypothetical protein